MGSPFGWKYWSIVGIEPIALFGGSRIIGDLSYPELGVTWVAFVADIYRARRDAELTRQRPVARPPTSR